MAGAAIHADDTAAAADPCLFGILHGDLNVSNFFFVEGTGEGEGEGQGATLSVFDWDQCQAGWFLWDLAQAVFTVVMLREAGLPVAGTPVPEADPAQFQAWLVQGYEGGRGGGAGRVDTASLARMVDLRKCFYERFCRRAEEEGSVPPDMAPFIAYIVRWFDGMKREG